MLQNQEEPAHKTYLEEYRDWLKEWNRIAQLNRAGDFSQGRAITDGSGNNKVEFE